MARAPLATRATSLGLALAVLVSCGGSTFSASHVDDAGVDATPEAGASDAGPPPYFVEACTDGPRWPNGSQFSYERDGPTDAGPCTPHCGPSASASSLWGEPFLGMLTSAALPSGSCAHEGNTCTMAAEWLGPCPPGGSAVGPFDLFICRCTSGRWGCTIDDGGTDGG